MFKMHKAERAAVGSYGIHVAVEKGCLDAATAEVLACTISPSMDLRLGAVSKALLKRGGKELQIDVANYGTHGKIAIVPGYKLHCKHVYFGVMLPYEKENAMKYKTAKEYYRSSVHEFLVECLDEADYNGCHSIAFPAIGAGNLGYPVDIVADEMFESVENWSIEHTLSSLRDVRFVIFPSDEDAILEFSKAQRKHGQNDEKKELSSSVRKPVQKSDTSREHSQLRTTTMYLSSTDQPNIVGRRETDVNRILMPIGYTTGFVELRYSDLMNSLKDRGCDVTFTEDEMIIRGAPDIAEIAIKHLQQAIRDFQESYPSVEDLDLTQSNFRQTDVIKRMEEIQMSTEVHCTFNEMKTNLKFYGRRYEDVKKAKEKIIKLLLPPRKKAVDQDQSSDVTTPDQKESNDKESECTTNNDQAMSKDVTPKQVLPHSINAKKKHHGIDRQFSLSTGAKECRVFVTKENIVIKVYSADILSAPVDSIVNSANVNLAHGAGIARAIAKAAGKDLIKEGYDYLNSHGKLKVGEACATSAGKMSYKCIIHAVGPCWDSYKPHSMKDVEKCEVDLRNAVINSLSTAEQSMVQTLAVPSLSSGIYGCPRDLCSVQYAQAILDYSRLSNSPLAEIHFVDTDLDMVRMIQDTFETMIPGGNVPTSYNKLQYVSHGSRSAVQKHVAQHFQIDSSPMSSNIHREEQNQHAPNVNSHTTLQYHHPYPRQSDLVIYPYYHKDTPPGRARSEFCCCFGEGQNMYIYTGDILSMKKVGLIVCGNNRDGKTSGKLAKALSDKGGITYRQAKEKKFSKNANFGDVVLCDSGDMKNFKWIAHAILYKRVDCKGEADRIHKVNSVFENIFRTMKDQQCHSVALPLIGTGQGKGDPIFYAERVVDSLLHFSQVNKTYRFSIHLVHMESGKTQTAIDTVNKTVREAHPVKAEANKPKLPRPASAPSTRQRPVSVQSHSQSKSGHDPMPHNREATSVGWRRGQGRGHKTQAKFSRSIQYGKRMMGSDVQLIEQEDFSHTHNSGMDTDGERNNEYTDQRKAEAVMHTVGNLNIIEVGDIESDEAVEKSDDETGKKPDVQEDTCVICMDTISNSSVLPCGHAFCSDCIREQFTYKPACPTCGKVCGIIKGDQPKGRIDVTTNDKAHCAGFEAYERIEITYRFQEGIQGPNHPLPGTTYKGINRTAYLPNNKKGREIRDMLHVAFQRDLVFTIGRSRTTGADGVITWNDIHHKTDPKPNTQFGYPDPTYLDRVTEELKDKGVTINDIHKPRR